MPRVRLAVLLTLVLVLALAGCQQRPRSTADVPRTLPASRSLAVMPFTQPTDGAALIMGQLPEDQGLASDEDLALLDGDLQQVFLKNGGERKVSFDPSMPTLYAPGTSFHSSGIPQALGAWAALARQSGKDYILVPQVIDWHERNGMQGGVKTAASVHLEFFLIRAETGTVQARAVYKEDQVGLTSNLLTVGDFFKRKCTWVSSRELADEGMPVMLRELGLI